MSRGRFRRREQDGDARGGRVVLTNGVVRRNRMDIQKNLG